MTLKTLEKWEESMLRIELKRLKDMGYTEEDAHKLIIESFDSNMTKLLLFLIYQEVKKNGR